KGEILFCLVECFTQWVKSRTFQKPCDQYGFWKVFKLGMNNLGLNTGSNNMPALSIHKYDKSNPNYLEDWTSFYEIGQRFMENYYRLKTTSR
ncbi:hypothetical protein, partial [Streptococcus sp. NLN76]|uniref:hypothetical protein n=1 Tax=Streptococcus sp. NLN76 TaxID=2822800 RepID=UPI001B357375